MSNVITKEYQACKQGLGADHVMACEHALRTWECRRAADLACMELPDYNVFQLMSKITALCYAVSELASKYLLDIPNTRILDVGCAQGYGLTPFLLNGFRADQLYGVDLFEDRIEDGKRKWPGLQLRAGDATSMPYFENDSFDIVCEKFCFCHITVEEARERIALEMLRVAKRNGFLMIQDWRMGSKRKELNGVSQQRIRELFAVGTRTKVLRVIPCQLFPPVGRVVSKWFPALYPILQLVAPFLVGSKLTVLQKVR